MGPSEIKLELERQWEFGRLAFPFHVAGWAILNDDLEKRGGFYRRRNSILVAIRGVRVRLKSGFREIQARRIRRHQLKF